MAIHAASEALLLSRRLSSRRANLSGQRIGRGLVFFLTTILAVIVARTQGLCARPERSGSSESSADFTIRLKDGQTRFRQGEVITLVLGDGANPGAPVSRYTLHQDRPGLAVDEFRLEPRTGVVDPLRDFLASVGGWSGPLPRPEPFVEEGGAWLAVEINEWFRFDHPGRYHLTVLAHPVRTRFEAFGNRPPGAVTVTSNAIDFEIIPADDAWKAATVQKAVGLLEGRSDFEREHVACRLLRFLTTPAAVDAMIRHYADQGICEAEYRDGLFAFPERDYAVRRMEDGLLDPSVAVSADYLRTLATLSAYRDHPEYLPTGNDEYLGKTAWSMGGPLAAHWNLIEREQSHYVEELLGALPTKTGAASALSLKAVFDSPLLGQPTLLASADAALLSRLRKKMAEAFLSLPVSAQSDLLYFRWENIASPAMVPVLRHLYENPPAGANEQFIAAVLGRLDELEPNEGRALILAEMRRPHPRLDLRFVRLLPDQKIPELDGPLAENLEASGGEDATIVELIGRYATPAIFPRVRAVLEDQVGRMPCEAQASFIAYSLESDPPTGAEMLQKALAARQGTRCYAAVLGEVASRRMTPEVEQAAVARLNDPDPQVAANAAGTLGRYGRPDAEQPLWERLAKWHASWAGRAGELPDGSGEALPNGLETVLEQALIEALGTGQNWLAGPQKLARLRSLCVSSGGCRRVDEMAQACSDPPAVTVYPLAKSAYSATVNQYQLNSLEALKRKLAQFPEGTTFRWNFTGDARQEAPVLADLREFLDLHGMTIR